MSNLPGRAWPLWLPWILPACGSPPTIRETAATWDSAGVHIVTNVDPTWTIPGRVDAEPLLTIGGIDADPDHELDQVTGAVRLGVGRIVVANGGRLELLFYDLEGHLIRKAGGRGGGPGEFESLEWLSRHGSDSIMALDVRSQRVSYFDADGNFGRSVRLEPSAELAFPRPVGFFGDGSFLATHGMYELGGDPPIRAERFPESVFRITPDGRTASPVGTFLGAELVIVPTGPRGGLERRGRPFGRKTVYATAGDRFYVADNASYEIRAYSVTGQLTLVIRREVVPREVTDADMRAYEDSVLAAANGFRRRQMRVLFDNQPPAPETYPAFAPAIHVDSEGTLWVKDWADGGDGLCPWSVFSEEGTFLGTVRMPADVTVFDIGAEYILGVQRDDLDVERLVVYRLMRGR